MSCKLIVGSYNLRTPGAKDPFPNDWESRMPRINEDIRRMGYHIFGAQETIDFYDPHICRGNSFPMRPSGFPRRLKSIPSLRGQSIPVSAPQGSLKKNSPAHGLFSPIRTLNTGSRSCRKSSFSIFLTD